MSPVQQSSGHATKALVLALLAVGVAVGVLYGASVLLTNRHNSRLHTGDVGGVVTLGKVSQLANHVNNEPTLYRDLSGNDLRNLWVQHLGSDPNSGWIVFPTQVPDQVDGCNWDWQPKHHQFVATCDAHEVLAADAPRMLHYPVKIVKGELQADLTSSVGGPSGTTGTS